MDYYCYISQTKVDQLMADMGEKNATEWIEESSRKSDKQAAGGLSKLLTLFSANLSYGRSDVLQTKVKLKVSYVSKLKTVLSKIAPSVINLETLSQCDKHSGAIYLYRNQFIVTAIDDAHLIACLEATEGNSKLKLHCSLLFFSESPVDNGTVHFHSSNYAFFQKRLPVTFETLFLHISQDNEAIYGSPIFLKLQANDDLIL